MKSDQVHDMVKRQEIHDQLGGPTVRRKVPIDIRWGWKCHRKDPGYRGSRTWMIFASAATHHHTEIERPVSSSYVPIIGHTAIQSRHSSRPCQCLVIMVQLPYAQFEIKGMPFESINTVVRLRAVGVRRQKNSTKSCSQRPLGLDDLDGLLGCFTRFPPFSPVKCLVKNSCNTWRDGCKPVVWDFRFVNRLRSGWFFVGVLVTVLDPFFLQARQKIQTVQVPVWFCHNELQRTCWQQ